jgi:uncharacterized membrane protein YgdD (TMEM256/DUF423 family)
MTARLALALAALLGAIAVATGAFGAHALKARLPPEMQVIWQTAVQYHFWHAFALALAGVFMTIKPDAAMAAIAAWLFLVGIALFSGSLYVLAVTGVRGLGAVTPLGGVALIAGWLVLAWSVWRSA